MRKILSITFNDMILYFRDPGAVIGTFLIPVVFAVVLGFAFSGNNGPTQVRVDVIDNDNTALSQLFLTNLRQANTALVLCPADNGEDDFCRLGDDAALTEERSLGRLSNNDTLALLVIPAGFEASVQANEPISVTYRSNENAAAPTFILQAVQAVVQRMGGALVASNVATNTVAEALPFDDDAARDAFRQLAYDEAAQLWTENPFSVNYVAAAGAPQASNSQGGFGQSVPGMASMFVTFTVLISAINLIRERKNWTLQRLTTMPVTRAQILAGKILMYFLLGMIQFIAMFGFGLLVTGVLSNFSESVTPLYLGQDALGLLLIMASLTLCMTALGFLIGTMIKTEMQGAALLNLLGLTLAPLGGAWWPLDIVPEFMRVVGHISPIAWAMDGFRKLLFEQGTLVSVLPEVGIMLAMSAVLFVFAIGRFRIE
jgi:ABC-2 type transport system permease protein